MSVCHFFSTLGLHVEMQIPWNQMLMLISFQGDLHPASVTGPPFLAEMTGGFPGHVDLQASFLDPEWMVFGEDSSPVN